MKLKFVVEGQKLRMFVPAKLVADTVNYFQAEFTFPDSDWEGMQKYAHFHLEGEELPYTFSINDENQIPPESGLDLQAGNWTVWLHGDRLVDGVLEKRITTDGIGFRVEDSGMLEGTSIPKISGDVAMQIMADLDALKETVGLMDAESADDIVNVKAVNHRGFCTEAPENTIPAYILSKEKGFRYVECDVSFTRDSVAVLLHNSTIDATSDGTGSLSDMSYRQVLQYDFGSWKSEKYAGTKIASFKEFIALCKNLGLYPYIELKSGGSYSQKQITSLVDIVQAYGMRGRVTYISNASEFLNYVKEADGTARLGYLVDDITDSVIETANRLKNGENEVFIDANYINVTDKKVALCIEQDLPLEVWTVNDAAVIEAMNPYISGVTSDTLNAREILFKKSQIYVPPTIPDMTPAEEWAEYDSLDLTEMVASGGLSTEAPYVLPANTLRAVYVGTDLLVSPGDVISVRVADTFRWGIHSMNETAYTTVQSNGTFNDEDKVDSGWLTGDYTIPDGAVAMWIVFSKKDNTAFTTDELGTVLVLRS